MRSFQPIWLCLHVALIGAATMGGLWVAEEVRTSFYQARHFSAYAQKMTTVLENGANPDMQFPTTGPYNQRLGYTFLPFFIKSMRSSGYQIDQQAQASDTFDHYVSLGGIPIYDAKATAGLTIYDRNHHVLHAVTYPTRTFQSFQDVPTLLTDSLLFIENRELLQTEPVTRNPVIEWKRLATALLGLVAGRLSDDAGGAGGASTLATQLEKFRFSPEGMTGGVQEKLRQIVAASLRVYRKGHDTTEARKQILLDYLNSTPLAARPGWGEIIGMGDGLWAWFGLELKDVATALQLDENNPEQLRQKAQIYRAVLALIASQRRPGHYLVNNRADLETLVDTTLDRMHEAGIVSAPLYEQTKATKLAFLTTPPPLPTASFVTQKAANSARAHLLSFFGTNNLYELDRFDMRVTTTLDLETQMRVTDFLAKLKDPAFINETGLTGDRLLNAEDDPTKVKWTITVFERGNQDNEVRVQADNFDGPMDLNESAKLDLGSTAKLRTLITYLDIMAELHQRYSQFDETTLHAVQAGAGDALSQWAIQWLLAAKDKTLPTMLTAAMQRPYSANPGEHFFTGGGMHTFVNFEKSDNNKVVPLAEAFRKSINLPFIRVMRDVVNYTIAQGPNPKREILGDPSHPARREFLERFADREGSIYLNRYYNTYAKLNADAALDKLISRGRQSESAIAVIFRSVFPEQTFSAFAAFMRQKLNGKTLDDERLALLYNTYAVHKYSLADRGYIAGMHPLELWLVGWRWNNPAGTRRDMLEASHGVRIASYDWLFTSRKSAQDSRIRMLLERDAFATIHQRWQKLGYPFERLVPSLATSIGSSADRPGALAELMGIILNGGVRQQTARMTHVEFAPGTPYNTVMSLKEKEGERVLPTEVAKTVQAALQDVVDSGTARRVKDSFTGSDGKPLVIGGKTGTGDHRFEEFAPGGRLISSRVVNRTATFVFHIGDKFFGTVTAHVAGEDAAQYSFTSALPAQMLKAMAPVLQPLITPTFEGVPIANITPVAVQAAREEPSEGSTQAVDAAQAPIPTPGPAESEAAPSVTTTQIAPVNADDTLETLEPQE